MHIPQHNYNNDKMLEISQGKSRMMKEIKWTVKHGETLSQWSPSKKDWIWYDETKDSYKNSLNRI